MSATGRPEREYRQRTARKFPMSANAGAHSATVIV